MTEQDAASANGPAAARSVALLVAFGLSLGFFFEYLLLTCFGCPPRVLFLISLILWPLGSALYRLTAARFTDLRKVLAVLLASFAWAYALPLCHAGLPWGEGIGGPRDQWAGIVPLLATVPMLLASGFTELALYERVGERFRSFRLVYAGLLVGTALGLPLGYGLNQLLGLTPILALGVLAVLAARTLLAPAPATRARWLRLGVAGLALLGGSVASDTAWLHRALSINWFGQEFERDGYERIYETWGRFGLFTIREKPGEPGGLGFYNDNLHWGYQLPKFSERGHLDSIPFEVADPEDRIAIIGGGGGRQIQMALDRGYQHIKVIELEPAVVHYFSEIAPERNGGVYIAPEVDAVVAEGRGEMERETGRFGFVYIADTGAARFNFLNLLNDASYLHTVEGLSTFAERLAPGGFIASYMQRHVDQHLLMRPHLEESFRVAGLTTWTISDAEGFVIFAARPDEAAAVRERTRQVLREMRPDMLPLREGREEGRELVAAHDIRPHSLFLFLFTLEKARTVFAELLTVVAVLAGVFLVLTYGVQLARARRGGFDWGHASAVGVLVGFNFALQEIYLVELLNSHYHEIFTTTLVASTGFLVLAGVGSVVLPTRPPRWVSALVCVLGTAVMLVPPPGWFAPRLLALLPLFLVTGSLFPSIARREPRWLLMLFVADALGALVGTVVALGVPSLWGLEVFGWVVAAAFVGTVIGRDLLLGRWARREARAAPSAQGGAERADGGDR